MEPIFQEKIINDTLIINALNQEGLEELISLKLLFINIYTNLLQESLKSQSESFNKNIKSIKDSLKKVEYFHIIILEKEAIFSTLELIDTFLYNKTVNEKAKDTVPKELRDSLEVLSFIFKNILKSF